MNMEPRPYVRPKVATATAIKMEPKAEESDPPKRERKKTVPKEKLQIKPEASSRLSNKRLLHKHLHNLKILLQCTNATMILKHGDKGYLCCYCTEGFEEPMDLKIHTLIVHHNEEKFYGNIKAEEPSVFLVKLDITNLKCILCSIDTDTLDEMIVHLTKRHKKNFHTDIKNQIFPFKFNGKQLKCYQCANDAVFATFKALQKHMNKHYRHFVCTKCDAGFINHLALSRHNLIHKKGTFPCRHCSVVFDNAFKRGSHELRSHRRTDYISRCNLCNEGFKENLTRKIHMTTVHGISTPKYDCTACDKSFVANSTLKAHVRRFHLMEKSYKCSECDKAFFAGSDLRKHIMTHTGEKDFKCEVCTKCFAKKSTLNQHMRIHNNDRRFKCTMCDKAFVQKPSLNWHMKATHAKANST